MPIWDYNDKFYLKINGFKIRELPGEPSFQKGVPYIMGITFRKHDVERMVSRLLVIAFLKLMKCIVLLHIYRMGLSESALKPFSFFKSL